MSIRRAVALTRNLPNDSATARAVHGDSVDWTVTDHLLAHIGDLLAAANWQRAGDNNKPKPKPIQRPGVNEGRRRLEVSGVELRRRLEDLKQRTGR